METGKIAQQESEVLKKKISSGLLGGAIGDALGAPVEMTTQAQILAKQGRVEDYLPMKHNMFFAKHGFESDESGWVTDDTLLTFALVKSYNELGRLDIADIFKKHQEEYESFPYGFGSATKYSMKNIQEGVPIEQAGKKDAAGNGVVMKLFPLAAIAAAKDISDEEMAAFIATYTRATHDSDIAVVASLVHHRFLSALLRSGTEELDKHALLQQLIDFIAPYEQRYPKSEGKLTEMLTKLQGDIDRTHNSLSLTDEEIVARFGRGNIDETDQKKIFSSGYVVFTLGIVYALFLREQDMQAIIDAVNIGGDTDSYAAIMGNMIGAHQGIEYEHRYIDGLQKKEEIIADIQAFIAKLFR